MWSVCYFGDSSLGLAWRLESYSLHWKVVGKCICPLRRRLPLQNSFASPEHVKCTRLSLVRTTDVQGRKERISQPPLSARGQSEFGIGDGSERSKVLLPPARLTRVAAAVMFHHEDRRKTMQRLEPGTRPRARLRRRQPRTRTTRAMGQPNRIRLSKTVINESPI